MKCKYCHQPAGFFSNKHPDCESKHSETIKVIREYVGNLNDKDYYLFDDIKNHFSKRLSDSYVTNDEFSSAIIEELVLIFSKQIKGDGCFMYKLIKSLPNLEKNSFLKKCGNLIVSAYEHYLKDYFDSLRPLQDIDDQHKELIASLLDDENEDFRIQMENACVYGLERQVDFVLQDSIITFEEEKYLMKFISFAGLENKVTLFESRAYHKIGESLVLRDLQEKGITERVKINGLPIVLDKNEFLVYVYPSVQCYEEKTGRKYVGGSKGVSMRICKGLYYRVGASKGEAIDYQYQNEIGYGSLIITNKRIVFSGIRKSFKIPIKKIVTITPFDDGVEIIMDGSTPKPYTFTGCDSWFIVNALQLVAE